MQDTDSFYRARISSFESERRVFQEYIALITPSKGELHVLDWEFRQGIANAANAVAERDRIENELKRVRKETNMVREQLRGMTKTSDARRIQIESLSELSQPVQKDTTYLVTDRFLARNGSDSATAAAGGGGVKPPLAPKNDKPKERASAAKLYGKSMRTGDIVQLENKLEEESRRITTLVYDLTTSLKEVNEGSARMDIAVTETLEVRRKEAAALVKEVDRLDYQGFLSVAELLRLRLRIMSAQREEVEELERLEDDKVFFAQKEGQMREQLVSDMSLMKRRLRQEASSAAKDFQSQHETLDELIKKLKRREWVLSQSEKSATNKYEAQAKLSSQAKERYERLRRRYALEMEGYRNEFKMLETKHRKLRELYEAKEAREEQRQRQQQSAGLGLGLGLGLGSGVGL